MSQGYRGLCHTVLGVVIALTLATLLVRLRYELEVAGEATSLRAALEVAAGEIDTELDRGERVLNAREPSNPESLWHAWELDAKGYRDTAARVPITESALRRALAGRTAPTQMTRLVGPFATDRGRNAIALARQGDAGEVFAWKGSWEFIDDLVSQRHIAALVKQHRLQLYDPDEGIAWFQSDDGKLDAPVVTPLRFHGSSLQLRSAPRDGWAVPLRILSSSVLVLLAVLAWLSYELRRGQAQRNATNDLAEAETRRRQLNRDYGKLLEDRAALESRLHLVSMYDPVTGLANRSSLVQRIEAILNGMRQSRQGTLCVMAIGFEHAHHIISSFGAEFASRVLVIAAERIEFLLPSKDLLFRTGDFHLAVVLPDTDTQVSEELAHRIITEIEAPIALDSHTFMLHPSVGVAQTASGYEFAEALLDQTNMALGGVRRDAPSRYRVFDSATAKASISRLQLEADLDRAFAENQLVLEYEPFVVPGSLAVAGLEALIRWDHPTEGRLLPGSFLPIALQGGMSHRLNNWVIRGAVRQAAQWRQAGHHDLFVNFNLSAEAFLRANLAEEIEAVLAEFDLPGRHIVVELTESILVQDIRAASRTLQRLAELGVCAWLDDFGTGYSSLGHLRTLPLKGVKIDRAFIERIEIEARDFGFLKALIDLIGYLGLQSICEGIETAAQYELLCLTTCDLYQGYHFSRSLSASEAGRWIGETNHMADRRARV